jgi:hypothetical protein
MENKHLLNKTLLNKVKKHILEEPYRLAMTTWMCNLPAGTEMHLGGWGEVRTTVPKCGTVGCIAGWITMIAYPDKVKRAEIENLYGINIAAKRALGISELSVYYGGIPFELFYVDRWPEPYKSQYFDVDLKFQNHDEAQKERAKIVAAVIDEFKKGWDKLHTLKKGKE